MLSSLSLPVPGTSVLMLPEVSRMMSTLGRTPWVSARFVDPT